MDIAKDRITTKALVPSSATRRRIFTSTARLVRTPVPAQSRLTVEVRAGHGMYSTMILDTPLKNCFLIG